MKKALVALICAGTASVAMAQGAAVTDFTGGSPFGIYYGASTGDVVGFRFTADVDMLVTDLGVLLDPGDGVLDSAHMVGIWRNSDMSLLASTSVDATGTLMNGFLYESIAPVALSAGGEYTIGAMYTADDNDSYISSPSTLTTNGISNTNGVFPAAGDLGFVYPEGDSTNLARLGGNFIWEVPAPGSLALLGLGGLAAVRRRR